MENLPAVKTENILSKGLPTEHEMMVYKVMADQAISSKFYASSYKDQSAVMMIMLAARELGIPPMQAINGGIHMIQGKVEISARMMSALIRKAGHKFSVKENTDSHCVVYGTRCDTGETQSASFSVAEAQLAGIYKSGGGWTKWPKDMCFARALSRLARQLFSDVIGIGYVEGEISQKDVIPEVEVQIDESLIDKYLELFDKEETTLALEYLNVVKKHFEWTENQAVQELVKDSEKLKEKFTKWKNYRGIHDQSERA